MRVCARWPPTFQVPFFVPAGGSSATPAFGAPSQLGGGAPAFGAASAPTPADTPASPFGAAPAASPFGAATPAPSPFAAAAAPASSPFGAAAPAASPFGVAAPAASPFGAAPAASAFGASSMGCATCARREEKPLTPRVRTWQVRRHRPSVLHPHSVAPQHLVLLPHLAARLRLGLHRQHRRLAHPPNSAEHQLSVRARFSAHIFLAPGPRQCVSFCSQVAKVFSAPPKAVVLLPPLQVVAVGLRATLLKRQAVDLGLWRRQAVLHLRRRLGGIAETSQRTMELGGRFRSSMLRPGRRQAFRHRHFGARRTAPSSQQQYKGYTVAREGQPGSGAIATLHGLLSGLVSMHSTQPRLYLR